MKKLRQFVLAGMFVFAGLFTLHAQAVSPAKLKINGLIGLGSTYAQVVKALGRPASETKASLEQCTGRHEKTAQYSGAMFYFMSSLSSDGKTFEVETFIVSSPKYSVSGVKVGDTEAVVRAKFGRRYTVGKDPESGARMWTYEMSERDGPGQTLVTFRNGKVARISSAFLMC
jgi:hypothetical protein